MQGIKILNTIPIMEHYLPVPVKIIIISAFLVVIATSIFFTIVFQDDEYFGFCVLFGIIVIITTPFIYGCFERPTGKYKYQVTIDDSVTYKQLTEKYEVLEQNGEIYTIKLKENDNEHK